MLYLWNINLIIEEYTMTIKKNNLMKQIADELYREMQEGLGF